MALTHKATHVEEAKDQLAQQFHGKAKLEALLGALIQQVQDAEDAAFSILNGFNLSTAVGDQLDVLGSIVGEARNGREDETYRLWIRARILLNRSSGKAEEIYAIFVLLIPEAAEQALEDFYPADFILSISGAALDPDVVDQLSLILFEAKAAGVGAALVWQESADADTFQFSSEEPGTAVLDGPYLAGSVNITATYVGGVFPANNFVEIGGTEVVEYDLYENPDFTLVAPGTTLDHAEGELVLFIPPLAGVVLETSSTQGFADVSTGGGGKLAGVTVAGELVEGALPPDSFPWLDTMRYSPPPQEDEGGGDGGGYFGPPV